MDDGGTTERIIIPYSPRPQFLSFHDTTKRWRAIVAHRRAGKTVACVNNLIRSALRCPLPNPRVAYIAPLYKQAKDVAWSYLKEFTQVIPGREVNESELRVDLPNGGRVRLYGADNPDALRGIYLDDCVLDEFADMRPRFLPEIIRPALSDRKGSLTMIGTPKGHNEFYDLYELSKADPDWFSLMLRASETKLVDAEELASAAKMMTEAQYAQEYECSFEAAIEGSYYGSLLETAEKTGRITDLPHAPALPVYTAWDLGVGDDTSIWFAQRSGGWLHIIDHYATNGQPASHYMDILRGKPYNYARHFLPHDADNREWSNGKSRLDTLKGLGLQNSSVLPRIAIDDGINAARLLLPICRFDREKCKSGIESLRHYRREYDENKRTFKPTPLHDWASHDADAFRYLAMGLEPEAAVPVDIPRYSGRRKREYGSTEVSWAN
jgi:phage terminase large subunit